MALSDQSPRSVVNEINRVWEAGDLEAALALLHHDCVFTVHATPGGIGHAGTWSGREQVRAALTYLQQTYEYLLYRPRIVSVLGDTVHVYIEFLGRHLATDERINIRFRQEFIVKNGLASSVDEYHDTAMLEAFNKAYLPDDKV